MCRFHARHILPTLLTYETMLLELFNQVRIKIALQLCNTVLKLGKARLNLICKRIDELYVK